MFAVTINNTKNCFAHFFEQLEMNSYVSDGIDLKRYVVIPSGGVGGVFKSTEDMMGRQFSLMDLKLLFDVVPFQKVLYQLVQYLLFLISINTGYFAS